MPKILHVLHFCRLVHYEFALVAAINNMTCDVDEELLEANQIKLKQEA
jgi:hypothetical protein